MVEWSRVKQIIVQRSSPAYDTASRTESHVHSRPIVRRGSTIHGQFFQFGPKIEIIIVSFFVFNFDIVVVIVVVVDNVVAAAAVVTHALPNSRQ